MADIETSTIHYDIEAEVKGTKKIEQLAETFEATGNAAEEAGKAAKAAGETIANSTSKAQKALESVSDILEKSRTEVIKDVVDSNKSKLDKMLESDGFSGTLANKMTPEQAGFIAEQTSKLDLLEQKVKDAKEAYVKLFESGVTGKRLTSALESIIKAQEAYRIELERTFSSENQKVANIITPEQAGEFAKAVDQITLKYKELQIAQKELAQYATAKSLGDDSLQNEKRIVAYTKKVQKLQSEIDKLVRSTDTSAVAQSVADIGKQAEKSAAGVSKLAGATNQLAIDASGQPLALPAPAVISGSAADEVVQKFSEVPSIFERVTSAVETARSAVAGFAEQTGISSAIDSAANSVRGFANAMEEMRSRGKKTQSFLDKLVSSFKRILFYRIIRTIIKEIGQAFGEGVNNLYQWSKLMQGDFAQSMDKAATASLYLKNSLGAALAPAINALVPILDYVVSAFVNFINVINQLIALFTGATHWTKAKKYPTEYAKAVTSGAGKAADALHKLGLAQIDELTILDSSHGKNGSGGGAGSGMDYSGMFEDMNSFDSKLQGIFAKIKKTFDDVMKFIQEHLESMKVILAGAALALGAILFFTGANVPLGLGLMVAGAVGLANTISANWNSMTPELEATIAAITGMVGGAFLTLGAILAFSGVNVPLGIAFIAAGAVALLTGAAVNWHSMDGHFEDALTSIGGIISGALIAIGGILAFSGVNVPLGIALIAAGAIGLAATIGVAWNNLEAPMKRSIGTITTIVSTALLAVGALLTVTGANIPLGLALLVAGTVGIATASVKWDFASSKVRSEMTAITTIAGISLLALGLMLVLTGAAAPLGFGMIIAGGASLASAVAINWNFITQKVDSILGDVKQKWLDFREWFRQKWEDLKQWWSNLELPSFKIKTPHLSWSTQEASGWVAGILSALGMPTSIPKLNVSWYANGGFPSAGDLFFANEQGAELVGSMNGRTAVANNDQIVEGIRAGVYDAVVSAMANGSFNANVYLDGRQISGAVVQNINSETRRTGNSPLLSY